MKSLSAIHWSVVAMFMMHVVLFSTSPDASFAGDFPKPGANDRCPVCGMFPSKFPKWAAGFVFQKGVRYFHCSPKCMLHNLNYVAKYQPGEHRQNIAQIWVTEYYTATPTDAHEVLFVVESSLVGPMGLDLIPVKGKDAAENLRRDYTGSSIVALEQVTPEILEKARKGRLKP